MKNLTQDNMDQESVITFKQFLKEETLLANIIASLLAKGEKVVAFVDVWQPTTVNKNTGEVYKPAPRLLTVMKVTGDVVRYRVSPIKLGWFELDDASDDKMYFKKEGDTWVIAEKNRKPILS